MTEYLVMAKAPVPGRVKTRLGADIGAEAAADLAALSLLDALEAGAGAFGPQHCHLALEGDLLEAVRSRELREALLDWTVRPQVDGQLGVRIAAAHRDLAEAGVRGPVLQVGMDTPQVDVDRLHELALALLDPAGPDALLGEATDGGWWVLGTRDPRVADAVATVPMSTPTTYADTLAALVGSGVIVGPCRVLTDVDHVGDAARVAAQAPHSRFGRAWTALAATTTRGDAAAELHPPAEEAP
ncbi:DUF2064 domain-containing protein [Nocardioidaceae bacterium]|nr:DUF2064 domain-containing protein [Nocardioidaceae bacterium]